MDLLTAKPGLLKQANLSTLRRVLKARGTATRAELAEETRLSSTTVRSLLSELLESGELESMGYDDSSGGRKAERYQLRTDRCYGAAFCVTDRQIHRLLVNLRGEILETVALEDRGGLLETLTDHLDALVRQRDIRSIGVGVPGIVEGGGFWRQSKEDGALYRTDLGAQLAQRYGLPVVLENDLNAITIGFGHCYQNEFPCEDPENTNMAYLHFEEGCVSAGFLAGGRLIRGCGNFAGELGLVPMADGRQLHERLGEPLDDDDYTSLVIQIICWICGILNPQYVVLGGPGLRRDCVGPIGDGLSSLLPGHMFAEILCSSDVWQDYHEGMASLTAERMFSDVQFVKE